ncbi:hypothetical protein OIU10_29835, partial [Escherichia coli]
MSGRRGGGDGDAKTQPRRSSAPERKHGAAFRR